MGFKDDSHPSEREKNGTILGSIIYKILQTYFYLFGTPVCMSHIIIYKYTYTVYVYIYIYISDTERSTVSLCVFEMFVSYIFIQQIL